MSNTTHSYHLSESNDSQSSSNQALQPQHFDAVKHFVEHLSIGRFCTPEQHGEQFQAHRRALQKNQQSHRNCFSLRDLAFRSDPVQKRTRIPNFLAQPYFYRGDDVYVDKERQKMNKPDLTIAARLLAPSQYKLLFEGTLDHKTSEPPRVCMSVNEFVKDHSPPTVTVDVDSVSGILESMGAFKKGWMFYPYTTAGNLMKGTTFGIQIRITDDSLPNGYTLVAPQRIPHLLTGTLSTWSFIKIYFLFPRIWLKRKGLRDATQILTKNQQRDFYELVLYPSFQECLSPSALHEIPSNFQTAKVNAQATFKERSCVTSTPFSRTQLLSCAIQAKYSHALTLAIRQKIQYHGLTDFEDFVIYYNGKGMKGVENCTDYTALAQSWRAKWNGEINSQYAIRRKQWVDLGRQFAATLDPDIGPETLLWKSCCLKKYHECRTKPFKHMASLPLLQYHLGGLQDVVSVTMTAQPESAQAAAGAPHSCFYSKTKGAFIVNTIEVFGSSDIDILAYGDTHLAAVSNASGARTASLDSAAQAYISGKNRAHANLEALENSACEAREEHRLRGDVFDEVLDGLIAYEERNFYNTVETTNNVFTNQMIDQYQSLEHSRIQEHDGRSFYLPFHRESTADLVSFLRGNLNKACMGFEMVVRDITTPSVDQATTATALLFVHLLRHSVLSKLIGRTPELYKDRWEFVPKLPRLPDDSLAIASHSSSSDDSPTEICEGLAMRYSMQQYRYAYFAAKIDWHMWRLASSHASNFFRSEPGFALAMQKRRQQVLRVDESIRILPILDQWLTDAGTSFTKLQTILDFSIGFIMVLFRHCVWAQLKANKALVPHLTKAQEKELLDGRVSLTYANIVAWVQDPKPNVPNSPDLSSSNAAFHQGDPCLVLDYLFSPKDPWVDPQNRTKKRDHWRDRIFRVIYAEIYALFARRLSPHVVQEWQADLYLVVHTTNPLLPCPDGTQLLSRKHKNRGYSWLAYDWITDLERWSKPVSCHELVKTIYPNRIAKHVTRWCKSNDGHFFNGTPPRLLYEDEFLGLSLSQIHAKLRRKWRQLR
jgi:hypothetical protein